MSHHFFKKGDFLLILPLLILILLAFLVWAWQKPGGTVVIRCDDQVVFEGSIHSDQEISLPHNTAVIQNGQVFMRDGDCPHQICVRHAPISKKGETIVCLPNRVVIEVR